MGSGQRHDPDASALPEHGVGKQTDAVCYIRSEAEQRGLQMLMGSDDEAKVYLNGKQIHKCAVQRPLVADQDVVPDITLNAGLNVLVFKVVNEVGNWEGSLRFADQNDKLCKDFQVRLTPEP